MFSEIAFFIKSIIKDKRLRVLDIVTFSVGLLLIVIFSGIGFTTFEMTSKIKIVLYAITFLYFVSLFIFGLKINLFKTIKVRKRIPIPSPLTFVFLLILLLTILSFLLNKEKSLNLNTYISFILSISISYFVLKRFNLLLILKTFKNAIFVLSLISIILFAYTYFSGHFFSAMYFSNDRIIFGNHLFLSTDFISGLTYSYFWRIRLSSIFWEPSVFGTMLICALVCDFFSKDRITLIRTVVFIIAILLTKSTSAYIIFGLFFCLFICYLLRKRQTAQYVFLFFLMALFLVLIIFLPQVLQFMAKILPSVFGKFVDSSSSISFTTRLYSFGIFLRVFANNVFGAGGVSAGILYNSLAGELVNSETSTFGLAIASFGFAGIVYSLSILFGILFNKKIDFSYRLFILLIVILMSNSQGQIGIIAVNIIYFASLSMVNWPERIKRLNYCFESGNDNRTVANVLFAKSNDGELSTNIIISLILKGVSIVLAFFTIPIYLKYFNYSDSTYGVWLAITSILSIITVFDFGMGNGLKNKLIKNINDKNDCLSKTYISSTYAITFMIGVAIFVVFSITIFSLNDDVIHTLFFSSEELNDVNYLSFRISFSLIMFAIGTQFCLKNITYILQAHQRNAITGVFMLITNICLLSFALAFRNTVPQSHKITSLAIAYNVFLNVPLLVASIILFKKQYKTISPSLRSINFKESKSVISIGIKFFVIQIGTLFIWSINEFVILFLFKKAEFVTEYSEYYRLFSLLPTILGTVIQQPIWTAISKADTEGDASRIKKYTILLLVITIFFIVLNIVLVFALPLVFDVWLGNNAPVVSLSKQLTFSIYSLVYLVTMAIVIMCNAFSLFKAQMISAFAAIIAKIPIILLSVFLLKIGYTWEIIIIVNMICYLPVVMFGPLEIGRYIKNKKKNGFYKIISRSNEIVYWEINI